MLGGTSLISHPVHVHAHGTFHNHGTICMAEKDVPCSSGAENSFGPALTTSCPADFDFTLLFEETILTALPLACARMVMRVMASDTQADSVKSYGVASRQEVDVSKCANPGI